LTSACDKIKLFFGVYNGKLMFIFSAICLTGYNLILNE
jgi:hypothetical protein